MIKQFLLLLFCTGVLFSEESLLIDSTFLIDSDSSCYIKLSEARKELEKGSVEKAIQIYLDPVIMYYKDLYKNETKRIYCASNSTESLYYLLLSAKDSVSAITINSNWATAYYMKAYALLELKNLKAGKDFLEKAIKLSPINSQYLSELAYFYQIDKNWDKALELFVKAEDVAELSGSKEISKEYETRALRGQGYVLVELKKLSEAKKAYKKCLKIDRNDQKAKDELKYIEGLEN